MKSSQSYSAKCFTRSIRAFQELWINNVFRNMVDCKLKYNLFRNSVGALGGRSATCDRRARCLTRFETTSRVENNSQKISRAHSGKQSRQWYSSYSSEFRHGYVFKYFVMIRKRFLKNKQFFFLEFYFKFLTVPDLN
jgi:hypothetical protein